MPHLSPVLLAITAVELAVQSRGLGGKPELGPSLMQRRPLSEGVLSGSRLPSLPSDFTGEQAADIFSVCARHMLSLSVCVTTQCQSAPQW